MQRLLQIKDLLARRQYAQALLQCESLIQETGGRGEVALMTARSLVGLARLQEAETWVQRARADLPDETVALRLLAQIYRRRGWRVRALTGEQFLQAPAQFVGAAGLELLGQNADRVRMELHPVEQVDDGLARRRFAHGWLGR